MSDKKTKKRIVNKIPKKNIAIILHENENVPGRYCKTGDWCILIGNIQLTSSRTGKSDIVHIKTGRADSLEGGDFRVCELEEAIQDFFDKNF